MSARRVLTVVVVTIAAVAAVVGAIGYARWVRRPTEVASAPLTVQSSRVTEESAAHRLVVDLPAVEGLRDRNEQRTVNAALRKRTLADMDDLRSRAIAERPDRRGIGKYELRSEFTVATFTDRVVSIRTTSSEYTGGAHPLASVTTFTYDFGRRREVTIGDVLDRDVAKALLAIARIVREDLRRQLGVTTDDSAAIAWIERGTAPQAEHYRNFTVDSEAITFVFNPLEVAANAAGIRSVRIPYDQIEGFIRPGSVIRSLRRAPAPVGG